MCRIVAPEVQFRPDRRSRLMSSRSPERTAQIQRPPASRHYRTGPWARTIAERLEIHHTPKHSSWLNIAEVELSVLSGRCLNRRISDPEAMRAEIFRSPTPQPAFRRTSPFTLENPPSAHTAFRSHPRMINYPSTKRYWWNLLKISDLSAALNHNTADLRRLIN